MDESNVIEKMQTKLQEKLNEAAELKRAINTICEVMGQPPIYQDVESEKASSGMAMKPDEFYGKPLSTAVREYLIRRDQAAPVEEILQALEQHSFDFDDLGWTATNRLRNLAISLAKNTAMFRKLPNGMYGLKAKYGEGKGKGKKGKAEAESEAEQPNETPTVETAQVAPKPAKKAERKAEKETGSTGDTAEPEVVSAASA